MKKIYIIFSYIISFCLIMYLGGTVFLNNYFNNYFYKTPNFIGLTKGEASKLIPKNTIFFKEIGKDYSKLPRGQIFMQEPHKDKIVKKGRVIKVWVSLGENSITIPDFSGHEFYEVRNYLEEKQIKIKNISRISSSFPYNSIITTSPQAGEIINAGDEISLLVSDKLSNSVVKIPDLIGYTLDEAKEILTVNSLLIGKIVKKNIPSLENNIVVDTSLEAGKKVQAGSSIDLVVSEK